MPFKPYTFDDSVAQIGQGGPRLNDGDHLFEVDRIEPTPEDYEREWAGFYFRLRVAEGPSPKGARQSHYATSKPDTQFGFGQVMAALGIDPALFRGRGAQNWAQHKAMADQLSTRFRGRKLGGLVGDQAGNVDRNGRPFKDILELYTEAQYRERAAAAPAVVAPAGNGQQAAAPVETGDDLQAQLEQMLPAGAL